LIQAGLFQIRSNKSDLPRELNIKWNTPASQGKREYSNSKPN
jgi:hypothetical protein